MRIVPLFAHNPSAWTGAGNHTYLLEDGGDATLIDAGVGHPEHLGELQRALSELRSASGDIRLGQVLVTHAHEDHAAGAPVIAAAHEGARFSKLPWPERDVRYAVPWQPLRHEEAVRVGASELVALHTPGHAPDHLCFFDQRSGVLFGGDLVVQGGTVAILASAGGSLGDYLASLRSILELQPRRILPAHGSAIEEPATLLRSYLAHRAMRERQIADLVGSTPQTVDDLVSRIYAGLAQGVLRAASESVLAHLHKLRDENRVVEHTDAAGLSRWTGAPGH